jgi:hypothetical protein
MSKQPLLEVQRWKTNSELIQAMFEIHVNPKKWAMRPGGPVVMDVTYGKGVWWHWRRPEIQMRFIAHDIKIDGVDFTNLPEADESADVVAFDPDYIAPGGRDTSTINEFNERYGLDDVYESPASLQAHMNDGLGECARVLRPQGLIFAKCMTYISSKRPWLGEFHTIEHGLSLGLKVEDIAVAVGDPGPQPKRDTQQQHLRSNSSRLIVFRKPGRRTKCHNQ